MWGGNEEPYFVLVKFEMPTLYSSGKAGWTFGHSNPEVRA